MKQARYNQTIIWKYIRKWYVGKLCAIYKLKYEQCFGKNEWMYMSTCYENILNGYKYMSIGSIYYVVKRLIHCNNMTQKSSLVHYHVIVYRN